VLLLSLTSILVPVWPERPYQEYEISSQLSGSLRYAIPHHKRCQHAGGYLYIFLHIRVVFTCVRYHNNGERDYESHIEKGVYKVLLFPVMQRHLRMFWTLYYFKKLHWRVLSLLF